MLDYRTTPLPVTWPGPSTPSRDRRGSPFRRGWTAVLSMLAHEIEELGGRNTELAVDVEQRHITRDGRMYANASPASSSIIVSFDAAGGRLAFPCDTFDDWQDNVYAVALTLEKLRAIDRYGVRRGAQYSGFKALPASTQPTMSTSQAAETIVRRAHRINMDTATDAATVLTNREFAHSAIRSALARTHPDLHGGKSTDFLLVGEAKRILEAHHGTRF